MKSYNAFKRAVQNNETVNQTDLNRNNTLNGAYPSVGSKLNTELVTINGKQYLKVLPGEQQFASDQVQLKKFPQYRMVTDSNTLTEETVLPTTTSGQILLPVVDPAELNRDVYNFLDVLSNDLGSRIFYYLDSTAFNSIIYARDLITDDQLRTKGLDSVSSNIIIGMNHLKTFLFNMGKKIAPKGVNPYLNTDINKPVNKNNGDVVQNKSTVDQNKSGHGNCCPEPHPHQPCNITVNNITNSNGSHCDREQFPDDINTFLNCLDTLINVASTEEFPVDFNLEVFQTILHQVSVTKFEDQIISSLGTVKQQPKYNMLPFILLLIKIDTLFFSILYRLNLHNAFKSPMTGAYYGKKRTIVNENGVCVASNKVTNQDIFNSTILLEELLNTIIQLITFIPPDSLVSIMDEYFSVTGFDPTTTQNPDSLKIIIDSSALNIPGITDQPPNPSTANIPCFMYGYILSFCDCARQILTPGMLPFPSENTNPDVVYNPEYEPTKVASHAINAVYGMLAVQQLIEDFMKSRAFITVLSLLYLSGVSGQPNNRDISGANSILEINRNQTNNTDLLNLLLTAIFGSEKFALNMVVPASTIPGFSGDGSEESIQINTAQLYAVHNKISTISRILFGSHAPILKPCDFEWIYEPTYECPPYLTTTIPPTTQLLESPEPMVRDIDPTTTVFVPDVPKYVDEPKIEYLLEYSPISVVTENGMVIGPMKNYVEAYANYILVQYNMMASEVTTTTTAPALARNIFEMVTRGVKLRR